MTDTVTVSRELLQQAIDALNEADNVLTSSMFAESADSLRAALDAEPAPEAKPEKLNPLTQLQVAYVMGSRDANSAPQPAPVQEPVTWNQVQVCTWIGNQLMTQPSMFERNAVCKFVRSLGRNEKLAKYFPAPMAAQPRKAVKLTAYTDGSDDEAMERINAALADTEQFINKGN